MPEKTALTNARGAPVRMTSRYVRSPRMAEMASITMDLPAPVSPVSTLKPQSKQISACSITAIFSMCSTFSIIDPSVKEQCAEAALSV